MRRTRSRVIAAPAVVGLTVLATLLSPAPAQVAPGDGRALDNNLQLGAGGERGGANPPAAVPDWRARNDLITGNAGGLGYFRDRVGYGAAGEFGDRLGANDLFRFRARSLSPVWTGPPSVTRLDAAGRFAAPRRVEPGAAARVPRAFSGVTLADVLAPRDPGEERRGPWPSPGDSGRRLEVETSPLLGVRRGAAEAPALPGRARSSGATWLRGTSTFESDSPSSPRGSSTGARGTASEPRAGGPASAGRSLSIALGRLGRLGEAGEVGGARRSTGSGASGPAVLSPSSEDMTNLERAIMRGSGNVSQDGVYGLLLERFRAASDRLEPPADVDAKDPAAGGEVEGGEGRSRAAPMAIEALLARLDHDLPPVATLAGRKGDKVDRLLGEAESLLAAGRYFDAEAAYRRVLWRAPGHPMARVGAVHAELAAGLLRTAAYNLRLFLADHPELIAVRYESRLLPPAERLAWVRAELEAVMRATNRPEPAMLFAYVGYQTGSQEDVRKGLARADAVAPRDPLQWVLRRLWLDPDDSAASPPRDPVPRETDR